MTEFRSIHLEELNMRLDGNDKSSVDELMRQLPAALARQFDGSGVVVPRNCAEEVAAQVAGQVRDQLKQEGQ